jgi:hypothetical protein
MAKIIDFKEYFFMSKHVSARLKKPDRRKTACAKRLVLHIICG